MLKSWWEFLGIYVYTRWIFGAWQLRGKERITITRVSFSISQWELCAGRLVVWHKCFQVIKPRSAFVLERGIIFLAERTTQHRDERSREDAARRWGGMGLLWLLRRDSPALILTWKLKLSYFLILTKIHTLTHTRARCIYMYIFYLNRETLQVKFGIFF